MSKKKIKLQVPSKRRGPGYPKWIPSEKRMQTYVEPPDGDSFILVDEDAFLHLHQRVCSHPKKYEQDGIVYCEICWKALEID